MSFQLKRISKAILISLVICFSVTKIYFGIDNYSFELEIQNNPILAMKNNYTSLQKTLALKGYKIYYQVSGQHNKNTIVFIHPAFSDHRAFNPQIDYFSTDYKVITIDLIGHGLSKANQSTDKIDASAEHIFKILEQENIDSAHLVGVSIGALIAQHFALKYPTKTHSLTALGAYDINEENKEVASSQKLSNLGLVFRALFSMKSFRKKTAQITCQSKEGQALFYETSSHYERKSFLVMQGLNNIIKNREAIVPPYPTLIMVGEFDIPLAKKMAQKWHKKIENSVYSLLNNAGHCGNLDAPQVFNERVKTFIDQNN